MSTTFTSVLPSAQERRRLQPYEASRLVVQAYKEAIEELKRQGKRPTLHGASRLLGVKEPSTYHSSVEHCQAVEVYGISPDLGKNLAIERYRELDPGPVRIAKQAALISESRSHPETLADAVAATIKVAADELSRYEVGPLAAHIGRYALQRGSTKSALKDLINWLSSLEKAL